MDLSVEISLECSEILHRVRYRGLVIKWKRGSQTTLMKKEFPFRILVLTRLNRAAFVHELVCILYLWQKKLAVYY